MIHFATLVVLGCTSYLVVAQEKVCSSFCTNLGMMQSNPGKSCDDIYQINKAIRGVSDYYWINTTTGVHQVYCDMELQCGGYKGGWMRIVDLDTSRGDDCPTGWTKITTPNHPTHPEIDVCRSPNNNAGCYSTSFTVNSTSYYKICGKARGYQKYTPDGFNTKDIDSAYVDGLSITIGNPRKHVWTYAVGYSDDDSVTFANCPCAANPGDPAHSFINGHYYCESGTTGAPLIIGDTYFTSDPLWDGSGCVAANNNCCTAVGQPWFFRQFPTAQQDDIEVRLCSNEIFTNEAVVVDQMQFFIQ